jgi:hypothetical protein
MPQRITKSINFKDFVEIDALLEYGLTLYRPEFTTHRQDYGLNILRSLHAVRFHVLLLLETSIHYFSAQLQLIRFYNRDGLRLLRGTD